MNVLQAGESREPWSWKKVPPEPGVTYVFGIGPVPRPRGPRTLFFGWTDGKLEPLDLVPDRARSGRVVLGPGFSQPGVPLPAQVREARAMAAIELAWAPALRSDLPRELVFRILEVSAKLHAAAPWDRLSSDLAIDMDGRHTLDAIVGRHPCGCAGIDVFPAGTLARARQTHRKWRARMLGEQDLIALSIGDEPTFAVEPLRDAGWPVVPAMMARRGGKLRRLEVADVETLEMVARVLVDGEAWIST